MVSSKNDLDLVIDALYDLGIYIKPSPLGLLGISLIILASLIMVGFSPRDFLK